MLYHFEVSWVLEVLHKTRRLVILFCNKTSAQLNLCKLFILDPNPCKHFGPQSMQAPCKLTLFYSCADPFSGAGIWAITLHQKFLAFAIGPMTPSYYFVDPLGPSPTMNCTHLILWRLPMPWGSWIGQEGAQQSFCS